MLTVNGSSPAARISATFSVTSTTNGCSTSNDATTCTFSVAIPPGNDEVQISAYSSSSVLNASTLLSQQITTVAIAEGTSATPAAITLDANPQTMTIATPASGTHGTYASGYTGNGTQLTFTLVDATGNPIGTGPGAPSILLLGASGVGSWASHGQFRYTPPLDPPSTVTPGDMSTATFSVAPASSTDGLSEQTFQISVTVAAPVRIFLTATSQTSWAVPSNWNAASNEIEVIGGGGGGGGLGSGNSTGAGGGGAYSAVSNVALMPEGPVTVAIGSGGAGGGASLTSGGDTFLCASTAPSCASLAASLVGAKGGSRPASSAGGAGGSASVGVGSTKYNGGAGGSGNGDVGGGGGGAAGPFGAGAAGGAAYVDDFGFAGGGGGGGNGLGSAGVAASATSGGAGGSSYESSDGGQPGGGVSANGTAGGGGAGAFLNENSSSGYSAGAGGSGVEWDSSHGSGGGGGGGGGEYFEDYNGGAAGLYGGGGGSGGDTGAGGAQGIIVITYTPF